MSLRAFAEQSGLSERHIQNCAKAGRIVGARQNPLTKKWWVYPPAKLVDKWGDAMPRRAEPAGGFGISPHGLSADLPLSVHETCEASSISPSAKPVLTLFDASAPVSFGGNGALAPSAKLNGKARAMCRQGRLL